MGNTKQPNVTTIVFRTYFTIAETRAAWLLIDEMLEERAIGPLFARSTTLRSGVTITATWVQAGKLELQKRGKHGTNGA